jgi:ABC-type taurine transport system substrate-binding protein
MNNKIIVASIVWIIALSLIAVSVKFIWFPHVEASKQEIAKQEEKQKIEKTSSESYYNIQVDFGYDSFSGYSVYRSPEFAIQSSSKKMKINFVDDGANYKDRLLKLKSGDLSIATFTIDALIKASAEIGDVPATIVAITDETRGADGLVAYKQAVPNIDALNDADMKFVLTKDSPSETLARVLIAHFGLNKVSQSNFVYVKDAEEVYKTYRTSKPDQKQVYVLWEPYISKMIENPNAHVIVDSSRFRGYISDVIVASRDFLFKNPQAVQDFVEAYFRASYSYAQKENGFIDLSIEDSRKIGQPLTLLQAERLVNGIWWKNTQENFAHFGLNSDKPLQHIEDMILNITKVLISTGGIQNDPTGGQPNLLYYDKALVALKDLNFHPGFNPESIRADNDQLPILSDKQWDSLITVGTLDVPQIVFARGTSNITEQSKITLDELIQKLKSWRSYYVVVRGDASLIGDIEANKSLALERSKSVQQYLLDNGVDKSRVRAVAVEQPTGSTSVIFQMGYTPY